MLKLFLILHGGGNDMTKKGWVLLLCCYLVIPLTLFAIIRCRSCSKEDGAWMSPTAKWVPLDNRTLETFTIIEDDYQLGKLEPGDVRQILVHGGETKRLELRYVEKLDFMPNGVSIVSFNVVPEYKRIRIVYKRISNGELTVIVIPEMRNPESGTIAPGVSHEWQTTVNE